MVEGTRFARLEVGNSDLQKTQGLMDDKLTLMDTHIERIEESLHNMESMIRRVIQDKTVDASTVASVQKIGEECSMTGLFHGKGMKVEVPRFNGEDAEDWIFKIKEFFEIYGVLVEQRIKIFSFHMEGAAYSWYKWVIKNELVQSWNEFLTSLQLRFGTSLYDDPKDDLKELKQTSTVSEYQSKFEEISTMVTGLSESWIISFLWLGCRII